MSRLFLPFLVIAVTASLAAAAPVPQPNLDHEVHVVGLYEGVTRTGDQIHGGKAAVRVDRPGKTVTLVLTAYDSVTWDVTFTPQARLEKVILGGYHRQAVRELPRHIRVVEAFSENRPGLPAVRHCYRLDSAALRPTVRQIYDLTQREIASFQGSYRFDPERPFVVDRVQADPRLRSDYPRPTPAAQLPKLEFRALHPVPGNPFRFDTSYGDFSLTGGPKLDTLQALPPRVKQLAVDPATKAVYGLTAQEVVAIDLPNRTAATMDLGLDVPRLSSPCGITFDTQRQRLIVASLGGVGYLYAYTPKGGKWSVLADLKHVDLSALAYHPNEDALFGLAPSLGGNGEGGVPVLYRYNDKGALVSRTKLGEPMFPGIVSRGSLGSHVQLIPAGNDLVVLATTGQRRGGAPNPETFLYLVEPKTAKVRLTWRNPER